MVKKQILFLLFGILVIAAIVLVPVQVPLHIESKGQLMPVQELQVSRTSNGLFMVRRFDHLHGVTEPLLITEFARGDAVSFKSHYGIMPGAYIAAGDTIGRIESSTLDYELTVLKNEYTSQQAVLHLAKSGEKTSVVEEYQRMLARAEEEYNEQQRVVSRLKNLSEIGHVPYQDYELALSRQEVLRQETERARAALKTVTTGVKPQEIELLEEQINGTENAIAALEERRAQYTIITPISGVILETGLTGQDDEILIRIGDMSKYCVVIPVSPKDSYDLFDGCSVDVRVNGSDSNIRATVVKKENVTRSLLYSGQVVVVIAIIENVSSGFATGTFVDCRFNTGKVTLREYIVREFRNGRNY